jgi:hypothetical protein
MKKRETMAAQDTPAAAQVQALAAFDQSYTEFLDAFADVPDEALSYLAPGDEYVLGVLPIHLTQSAQRYMAVLTQLDGLPSGVVDLSADAELEAEESQRHAALVAKRPSASERAHMLADLDAVHHSARSRLAGYAPAEFARVVPVIYARGTEPYPTSAQAITGWLTEHYREHTAQTRTLLAQWREATA